MRVDAIGRMLDPGIDPPAAVLADREINLVHAVAVDADRLVLAETAARRDGVVGDLPHAGGTDRHCFVVDAAKLLLGRNGLEPVVNGRLGGIREIKVFLHQEYVTVILRSGSKSSAFRHVVAVAVKRALAGAADNIVSGAAADVIDTAIAGAAEDDVVA